MARTCAVEHCRFRHCDWAPRSADFVAASIPVNFQLLKLVYQLLSIIISALKARVWSKQILTKSHVSIWTSSVVRVTRCNTHAMMPRTRRMKHVPTLSRPAMPEKRLFVRSESAKRDDQHKKEKRTTLAARNRLSLSENVSEKFPPLTSEGRRLQTDR